ncbi:hypothetical protein J5N97_029945 [Dioscorea zingiberensis]|uniref:Uncharacterized protein n=1 Tax=Dioscorea zingiberensis TaxID=325984 RepID=A0A9D5H3N0_9LILI|nr:hypothetical protein J5N97_029945 [Dioscorea zingiberensis]
MEIRICLMTWMNSLKPHHHSKNLKTPCEIIPFCKSFQLLTSIHALVFFVLMQEYMTTDKREDLIWTWILDSLFYAPPMLVLVEKKRTRKSWAGTGLPLLPVLKIGSEIFVEEEANQDSQMLNRLHANGGRQ